MENKTLASAQDGVEKIAKIIHHNLGCGSLRSRWL